LIALISNAHLSKQFALPRFGLRGRSLLLLGVVIIA
jgi:hypothetical protein